MTRDELEAMRARVESNRAATIRSTERLKRMLDENAEDLEQADTMLAMLDAELERVQQGRTNH